MNLKITNLCWGFIWCWALFYRWAEALAELQLFCRLASQCGFVCLQMCCNCVSAVLSYDFELAECVPIGLPTTHKFMI